MSKIIDSTGKGAAIAESENDSNLSTFAGKNQSITATTHTIDVNDQGEVIEYINAAAVAVTLPEISTVTGANIHTDDFTVTLKNIGVTTVTITCGGSDTFDDGDTVKRLYSNDTITIQTDNALTGWNVLSDYISSTGRSVVGDNTSTTLAITTGLGGKRYKIEGELDANAGTPGQFYIEINGDTTSTNYFQDTPSTSGANSNVFGFVTDSTGYLSLQGEIYTDDNDRLFMFIDTISRTTSASTPVMNRFMFHLIGTQTAINQIAFKEVSSGGNFNTTAYIRMIKVK